MSEEKPASDLEEGEDANAGTVSGGRDVNVGHQLRLARESRGLSVDDVSSALKLSPHQVEAIEANNWSHLPKTIIRGFVRNYARYLDLDAAPLMVALDGTSLPQGPELAVNVGSPVSMPREGRGDRRDYVRVFSGLLILLLALLVYYFVPAQTWQSTLDSIKDRVFAESTQTVKESAAEAPKEVGKGTDAGVSGVPIGNAPAATTEVAPAAPASSNAALSSAMPAPELLPPAATPVSPSTASSSSSSTTGSGGALLFSFSQPSWVEVRDGTGQIIFSQLNQAGSSREISGRPPFSLVVGNASAVTLQYNGKPVDLSKRSKEDVARLTLE